MASFLSSIANKASSVLPGHDSHTLDSLQHSLRSFGQQYSSSTSPVQRIVTAEKGVALDFDSLSRNAKAQSKELYTWGQGEDAGPDLKDVTDRLAYLNFVQGSLAASLAVKLDGARAPLKSLRDAEAALLPKRNARAAIQLQINRIEHDNPRGMEKRLAELKEQLRKHNLEDQPQETEISLLKRQAVRESEQHKWEAIREFAEKLVLLSQAATPIIAALPTFAPTAESPYTGGQATGAARAGLQRALDNYKTGHIHLPSTMTGADLSRSETRSFGETHARELRSMSADTPSGELQPKLRASPPPSDAKLSATSPGAIQSPPIDPSALNLSPAPIPAPVSTTAVDTSAGPVAAPTPMHPAELPTVAETGVPVAAGAGGPGPASGSLHDIKAASNSAGPRSGGLPGNEPLTPAYGAAGGAGGPQKFESAAEEKKRLQAYSEAAQTQQGAPSASHETPEEEKQRLEREDRERLLFGGGGSSGNAGPGGEDDAPPSYQDQY
ncbi:sphingolipid long chain base-responsive protein pil1 [Favolaschia claudopus]|uniref:Sphingolipid long chain base-responsive protein pil1 n=1 Tax=Favolaschia claudopus TaxID=2862362 RepID=A0AAW0EHM3_9AGAR